MSFSFERKSEFSYFILCVEVAKTELYNRKKEREPGRCGGQQRVEEELGREGADLGRTTATL